RPATGEAERDVLHEERLPAMREAANPDKPAPGQEVLDEVLRRRKAPGRGGIPESPRRRRRLRGGGFRRFGRRWRVTRGRIAADPRGNGLHLRVGEWGLAALAIRDGEGGGDLRGRHGSPPHRAGERGERAIARPGGDDLLHGRRGDMPVAR